MLTVCKKCYNKSRRAHDRKRANLPHRVEARKKYKKENYEFVKFSNRRWAKNNIEKRRIYARKYFRKRYHSDYKFDPIYRINNSMSSNIYYSLKKAKGGSKWEDIVGYTANDLKKHLESLWEPWMNWENYGNPNGDHTNCWHIDHVIPKSWFNYTSYEDPEFKACWALSNLQPKEAKENIIKNNNYIG